MARTSRETFNKIVSHNMVQGINKEFIFENAKDKAYYIYLLKKYYKIFKIDILAYCIMDNHAHLLLYSDEINNLSKFMQKVNMLYANYYNKSRNRVGIVFRNRFTTKAIYNEKQLYICMKYIFMNPVKAGIVNNVNEYIYSSYNDFINQKFLINSQYFKLMFQNEKFLNHINSATFPNNTENYKKILISKVLEEFLIKESTTLERIIKNKHLIQKFISYLSIQKYNFTKKEIAEALKISKSKLYRSIKNDTL